MKKRLTILFLCLLLALPAGGAAGEGQTRCLLIGCDHFVTMPALEPASANNVKTMEDLLQTFLAGDPEIRSLADGAGSVEELEAAAEETFRGAGEADTALIYLSTHGILRQEESGDRVALLLSDGTAEEPLEQERLRQILDRIPGKKVLIVDVCHSGALIGMGTEAGINAFEGEDYRVLVSSGAAEESWFWNAETDAYQGTGYFTSALENALRASDTEQLDPDGSGSVSLRELTDRLREIHGASTVYCWPEESGEPLFTLPANRKARDRLQGMTFDRIEWDGDTAVLPIRFRAAEPVRLMYQVVPSRNGKWDFEHAVRLPDREKTGLTRGLLSPGEKERKIRLSAQSLGDDGRALMQIISLRGENLTPVVEAGRVIRKDGTEGNESSRQEIGGEK